MRRYWRRLEANRPQINLGILGKASHGHALRGHNQMDLKSMDASVARSLLQRLYPPWGPSLQRKYRKETSSHRLRLGRQLP